MRVCAEGSPPSFLQPPREFVAVAISVLTACVCVFQHDFPRDIINGMYFYTGPHHTGALQNWYLLVFALFL